MTRDETGDREENKDKKNRACRRVQRVSLNCYFDLLRVNASDTILPLQNRHVTPLYVSPWKRLRSANIIFNLRTFAADAYVHREPLIRG